MPKTGTDSWLERLPGVPLVPADKHGRAGESLLGSRGAGQLAVIILLGRHRTSGTAGLS